MKPTNVALAWTVADSHVDVEDDAGGALREGAHHLPTLAEDKAKAVLERDKLGGGGPGAEGLVLDDAGQYGEVFGRTVGGCHICWKTTVGGNQRGGL